MRLLVGAAVLALEDAATDEVSRLEDEGVDLDSTEGGGHGDAGGDVLRPASGCAPGEDAAEAVTDEVHGITGLTAGVLDRLLQPLREDVGTISIAPDAREIGLVADAAEPGVHVAEVLVGAHEAGNDDDAGAIALGNAGPAEDGRHAQ